MEQWEHPLEEEVTLFFKNRVGGDVILVKHLQNLLAYAEFLSKFNFLVTPKKYAVFDALWSDVLQLLQGMIADTPISEVVDATEKKCSSKLTRIFLQKVILPSGRFFWSSLFGDLNWNKIRLKQ